MDPSSGFDANSINKSELKTQELLVGAPRFELGTSCAQGRRATRLRYAPTRSALFIIKHFQFPCFQKPSNLASNCARFPQFPH